MRLFLEGIVIFLCILCISSCASSSREVVAGGHYAKKSAPRPAAADTEGAAGMTDYYAAEESEKSERRSDEAPANEPQPAPVERMVIQTARYGIEVDNVRSAVQDAEKCARDLGGFLESSSSSDSYRRATVVLRVPVEKFFQVLELIEKMGTVRFRQVQAQDVTMEFQDTSLRMGTAEKVRARLYDLLKRTEKVEEQVKILREIERLTAQIDSMKSRLDYLKSQASLSTITLEFTARVQESASRYIPSPFQWIRNLDPGRRSIDKNHSKVESSAPQGFFTHKDESADYLYSTPGDKVCIRLGTVENYPPADSRFWNEALTLDLANRHMDVDPARTVMTQYGLEFNVFTCRPAGGSVYLIAVAVKGSTVVVSEIIFREAEDYTAQQERITGFLKTVRLP